MFANKKIKILFFLSAIAICIFTVYALWNNIFEQTSFKDRIVSAATCEGMDINNIIVLYMSGIFVSTFLLYISTRNFIVEAAKFVLDKIEAFYDVIRKRLTEDKKLLLLNKRKIVSIIVYSVSVSFAVISLISNITNDIYINFFLLFLLICFAVYKLNPVFHFPMLCIPIFFAVLNEAFYIKNGNPYILFAVKAVFFIAAIVLSFHCKNDFADKHSHDRLMYGLFILGIVMMTYMPEYKINIVSDFFEDANYAVSISSFLNNNEIPVINNFDAHMLSDQIGGYLYAFLSGNDYDALFPLYSNVIEAIIIYIGAYMLLCYFTSAQNAMLIVFVFPRTILFGQLPFASFVIVAVYILLKSEKISAYFLYWFTAAFSILYKLDVGASAGIASVIIILLYFMLSKDKERLKKYLITFIISAGICISTVVLLCHYKSVDIYELLRKFILLTLKSNQNWGYGFLDVPFSRFFMTYFCYTIVFMYVFFHFIYNLFHNCKVLKKNDVQYVMITVAAVTWILNIPRTVVRHNLNEYSNWELLGTGVMFIILLFIFHAKNSKKIYIYLFFFLISYNSWLYGESLGSNIVYYSNITPFLAEKIDESGERVVLNNINNPYMDKIKIIFDELLCDNETYYDFSNQTLLYALMGRNNPVYENQSPGLINGEEYQRMVISELEENYKSIPCVLTEVSTGITRLNLANSIDEINNVFRYYLITEYIYSNYEIVVRCGEYDIWMRKSLIDDRQNRIDSLAELNELADFSDVRLADSYARNYEIGYIPYIWANFDDINIDDRIIIEELNDIDGEYSIKDSVKCLDKGNYIIATIEADKQTDIRMKLDYGDVNDTYKFKLKEGTNNYIIRVSTSYNWYFRNDATLSFDAPYGLVDIHKVSVAMGDMLE